jgi:hypothetical protein
MTDSIADRIQQIYQQIPSHVRLIAVTKTVSVAAIREAYAAGIRDFGENRLQEAIIKQEQLQDLTDVCWHFIGHLQANKAKKILEHFTWIHTLDSLKLGQRLNRLAIELNRKPQICLQVKIRPDPSKYGWLLPQLLEDLAALNQCQNLNIQGLMTILPWGLSEAENFAAFKDLANLSIEIKNQNYPDLQMNQLSMGMSGDYLQAINAGATMIRLGQIIFGKRKVS